MPRNTRTNDDDGHALAHAVEALRIELTGLRDAIDELREEIHWGNRNCKDYNPMLFRFRQPENDSLDVPPPAPPPSEQKQPPVENRPEAEPRRQAELW